MLICSAVMLWLTDVPFILVLARMHGRDATRTETRHAPTASREIEMRKPFLVQGKKVW